MSDNTTLNAMASGDVIRDLDRAGVKTQVMAVDGGGTGGEYILGAGRTTGTITANGQTVATGRIQGSGDAVIRLYGAAHAGVNITVEGTQDAGSNWDALPIIGQQTGVLVPSGITGVLTSNSTTLWAVDSSGFEQVRVRATAYTSGTLSVTITATPTNGADVVVATGAQASGAAVTGNPVLVGGSDGSLAQTLGVVVGDSGQNSALTVSGRVSQAVSVSSVSATTGLDLSGYGTVSVQITAQGTSATVNFQGSNDNATWTSVGLFPEAATGTGYPPSQASTTTTGIFSGPVSYRYFRLNVTGISAGTTTGTIAAFARTWAPKNLGVSALGYISPGGNAFSTQPLLVGGVDGSNLARTLLTDASGHTQVVTVDSEASTSTLSGTGVVGSALTGLAGVDVGIVVVAGSYAATLRPEVSYDNGTTWQTTNLNFPLAGGAARSGALAANATGTWLVSLAGASAFRLNCTAFTTNTNGTFRIRAATGPFPALAVDTGGRLAIAGAGAVGAAVAGNPVYIAGIDGSGNAQGILTGSTGEIAINELPTAAVASDALTNPTISQVGADAMLFNGTSWDRMRNTWRTTTGDTGTKTVTFNGASQTNFNHSSAWITCLCGTVSGTTPTMTMQLQVSFDSGTTWVNVGPATGNMTATGNTGLIAIGPTNWSQAAGTTPVNLTTGHTVSAFINAPLPRNWRVVYTLGGTTPSFAITSVSVDYIAQ